jgi:alkanesulfonate monooxygenase SsuD/methylene tetrahydromethanopterin reductase-like flavin-dependent oxidoreductase (luciferase family)
MMRERIAAMKTIWTQPQAEYHGELVDFPEMVARPQPVQKPHPPILVGGAFPHGARRAIRYGNGWAPLSGRTADGDVDDVLPRFRRMTAEAGRDPASLPVTLFGAPADAARLARYRDLGLARIVVALPSAKRDQILPLLDHWAGLIRRFAE